MATFLRYFLVLFAALSSFLATAQTKYSISGYVRDSATGETLIQAQLYVNELDKGTTTNEYGFYSLNLPEGNYHLRISYVGFRTKTITVALKGDNKLNIDLPSLAIVAQEITVSAERKDANVTSTSVGRQEIPMEIIKNVPVLMGEVDILKTLQLLPGIQSGGEGNTGFYVRGGGPDQNLVLLDEATVYNTGHLFGFFSVFNSDAIKSVSIEKGAIPANYGGRLSSVIDVKMKEGNLKKWSAEGGIGLIASRLTVQGPLIKDKCSIILSGRRTYIDLITKPFLKNYQGGKFAGNSYYFYDINAKINYKFSDKDRLFLSGYFGKDVFNFRDQNGTFSFDFPWGNTTFTGRWNHVFGDRLFMNAMVMYNNFKFEANSTFRDIKFNINSRVQEITAKIDFDFAPWVGHNMKFGVQYNHHIMDPYLTNGTASGTSFSADNKSTKFGHETAVYLLDDFDVNKWLRINLGLRASNFTLAGPYKKVNFDRSGHAIDTVQYSLDQPVKTYWGLEPRISARFKVAKSTSIKAGLSLTKQYIHLVSNSTTTLPIDLWVPSSPAVKPQLALQGCLGVYQNFYNDMFEASIEGYYKHMWNQIEYSDTTAGNIAQDVEDFYRFGTGRSYGAEFFFKKARGKFTGWIGYTLAWTNRQFPDVNYGIRFPAKFDRRHDLNIVLMYEINKKWKVSGVFVYASGNTTTLPTELYYVNGSFQFKYGYRNSYRLPAYHRLDLSVTYTFPEKPKKKHHVYSDVNFSIYNVYNRQNPFFVFVDVTGDPTKNNQRVVLKQASLFPILPSLTWNFKF
ncbi:MAG: TonB-dependent receptor [Chitinophagales bacterium]